MGGKEQKYRFRIWRFLRRSILALIFVAVAVVVFLHLVGIPGWVIERFIPKTKGVSIRISSAHLEDWTTISLNQVIISSTNGPGGHLTASAAKIGMTKSKEGEYWAWFSIPQSATVTVGNTPGVESNLKLSDARVSGNLQWQDKTLNITNLAVRWHGLDITARGTIHNLTSLTNWPFFQTKEKKSGKKMNWNGLLEELNGIDFLPGSKCLITLSADGASHTNLLVEINLQTGQANSRHGTIKQLAASALVTNLDFGAAQELGNIRLKAARFENQQVILNGLASEGTLEAGTTTNEFLLKLRNELESLFLARLSTTNLHGTSELFLSPGKGTAFKAGLTSSYYLIPGKMEGNDFVFEAKGSINNRKLQGIEMLVSGTDLLGIGNKWKVPSLIISGKSGVDSLYPLEIKAEGEKLESELATAGKFSIMVELETNAVPAVKSDLGMWTNLLPYKARFSYSLKDVVSTQITVHSFIGKGKWEAPKLAIEEYGGKVGTGNLQGSMELDVVQRKVQIAAGSDFDPFLALPLLPSYGQRWLKQFGWSAPPQLQAKLGLTLPAWTNSKPNWAKEVLPTLTIDGNFTSEAASFRKVPVSSASGQFTYSNLTWIIPEIVAIRPEGKVVLGYEGNNHVGNYYFNIDSYIDIKPLGPVLPEEHQKYLDEIRLNEPPHVKGEVFGKWGKYDQVKFQGTVTATNAEFRGVKLDRLATAVLYTNFSLYLTNLSLTQSNRALLLHEGGVDFQNRTGYVSKATNNLDPYPLAKAMHPQAYEAIAPYQFATPPNVVVTGTFGIGSIDKVHFDFNINGTEFSWDKLKADAVAGNLYWHGRSLVVTNVNAAGYKGGLIAGAAGFSFPKEMDGGKFQFDFSYKDVDLQSLINAWTGNTNDLEGIIEGQLIVTNALTGDMKSWNGTGWAKLTDGLIWEIPIFGIFSPLFDAIIPGLGKSKAREGSATFILTNSIVYSEDMEIRSPALRMRYSGTCDFEQNINAVVEAEILRDAWAVGRALSWVFSPFTKLLKFEVTGKLGDPDAEPVHIPRAVMFALRPFKSIKDLLTRDKSKAPLIEAEPETKTEP